MIRGGGGAPATKGVQPSSKVGGAHLLEEPTQLSAGGEIGEFEAGARIPKEGTSSSGLARAGSPRSIDPIAAPVDSASESRSKG